MLEDLKNATTRADIFEPIELGYYSYSPLCIQNIFRLQNSLMLYKITYMTCIAVLVAIVSVSYFPIVFESWRSSSEAGLNDQGDRNMALSVKVTLIIGSQLLCWMTLIILTVIHGITTKGYAPAMLYEITV